MGYNGITVLVVEDETLVRMDMVLALEDEGSLNSRSGRDVQGSRQAAPEPPVAAAAKVPRPSLASDIPIRMLAPVRRCSYAAIRQ
jgi:hypothetical protein